MDTTILIPYRDRKDDLDYFMSHTYPLLSKHIPNVTICIIEQEPGKLFNRGKLLNVGFEETKSTSAYIIHHDVDVNPTESVVKELYTIDISDDTCIGLFNSPCTTLGGICKFRVDTFQKNNGFPNDFWGWGVEDRALYNRHKVYNNFPIKYNYISNQSDISSFFMRRGDKADRHKDNKSFNKRTNTEYNIFHRLNKETQTKHIASSGLNSLSYSINEKTRTGNILHLKVSI